MCPALPSSGSRLPGLPTDQAVRHLGSILPQRPCLLCHLEEIVLLLEQGRDLKEMLRAKVKAAETEQKPFVRCAG